MGGFSNVIGHTVQGFENARQADLQRGFEDEQNRRAQIGGFLQKIAGDEMAHPYSRQQALQEYIKLSQQAWNKPYKFDPNVLVAPKEAQTPTSFMPPPQPPVHLGGTTIPAPPGTATLEPQLGVHMSPEQHTQMLAQRAGQVTGAQAGAEMKTPIYTRNAQGGFDVVPMSGAGQQMGPGIQNAVPSGMMLGRGQSNINYVDPETGQAALGTYDRITHQVISQDGQVVPNAVPIIPSLLPSQHQGFTYQTQADGSVVAIPVTTTSSKQLPSGQKSSAIPPPPASINPAGGKRVGAMKPPQALVINPAAGPGESPTAQTIRGGSKVNPQAVTVAGMSSANVPTSTIRTMAQRSQGQLLGISKLNDEIDKLDKAGQLGPWSGRINNFMQGKVGAGDPEYSYLNDKIGLLQTAMMLIHVGARGSTPILNKFQSMLDAGKMDAPTLKAGIRAIREQMEQYASEGKIPGFEGSVPKPPEETKTKPKFNWEEHPVIK